jgi:hypothetical protein
MVMFTFLQGLLHTMHTFTHIFWYTQTYTMKYVIQLALRSVSMETDWEWQTYILYKKEGCKKFHLILTDPWQGNYEVVSNMNVKNFFRACYNFTNSWRNGTVTDSNCYWQQLILTATVTDSNCYWQQLILTATVTDSNCYWQQLLLTATVTDSNWYWQQLLLTATVNWQQLHSSVLLPNCIHKIEIIQRKWFRNITEILCR